MSDVTRSTEATSAVSAAYAERRRGSEPVGWWGMALLIATEATLFGCLIATYFYLAFQDKQWPPAGVSDPKVALPLVLSAVLVASTVPMSRAVRSARLANVARARLWVLLALLIQGAYFGIQIHEYASDLDKFSASGTSYGSIYFTMLGAHHLHVFVGVLLSAWILLRTATGLTSYRMNGLRATAFYWHFVNVLALCVLGTQLSPLA
jgi:heme/copper-type cytochrome/quinol oxidase subunit 3